MEESQEINKKLAEGGLGAELGESKRHVKRLMKEMGNPQRNLDEEAAKCDKDELQDEIDRQEKELEDMTKMLDDKDRSFQGDIHNIGKKAGVLSIKLIEEQRSSVILSERYQHSVEKCVILTCLPIILLSSSWKGIFSKAEINLISLKNYQQRLISLLKYNNLKYLRKILQCRF